MIIKRCSRCESNATSYSNYCRKCESKRQVAYAKRSKYKSVRKRIKEIRAIIIEAKNKPCKDCKIQYPTFVMDFDHVRGDKKFILAEAAQKGVAKAKVLAEIEKCDVVCADCHRIRTYGSLAQAGRACAF